jgi:ADP-heptose:LPS heptosyltransferase
VVEQQFAGVFQGCTDIDEISTNLRLRIGGATLVLNLHGGPRSMLMMLASGAKYRVGFAHHRNSFLYSHKIPRPQEILGVERRMHTAEHLASAMFWMGVPQREIARAKLGPASAPKFLGPYAVIHPFASTPAKTWPVLRFVEIARHLRAAGLEPVFLAGSMHDSSPFSYYRVWRNVPLAYLKGLMSGASLFIGNDSGPAHIAAAFGVPAVVLFGPSDSVAWAPWRTQSRVMTASEDITRIQVSEVIAAAESLMETRSFPSAALIAA